MTFDQECEFSCRSGECRDNVCGDGFLATEDGEQCDDGNTRSCDACESCRNVHVGRINASTTTTSDRVWGPLRSDLTIEAWIDINANGSIAGIGDTTGTDYVHIGVAGGRLFCTLNMGHGPITAEASTVITGTGWHHVACVRFDQLGVAAFVDGLLDGINYVSGDAVSIDTPTRIWLGSDGTMTSAVGRIDDLRISNVVRYTERFIPPLRVGTDANTIARYRFDEGVGDVLGDSTGNGHHLALTDLLFAPDNCYGGGPGAACGDGTKDPWEQCDDGNTTAGDACSPSCRIEGCDPPNVLGPGGHCYRFGDGATWTDARATCRGWGGDLVTINNVRENAWLALMRNLGSSHWIGLNDRGDWEEGDYRWSGPDSAYRNWSDGEPNNGGTWTQEDCVLIFGADSGGNAGHWNDAECDLSVRYICER